MGNVVDQHAVGNVAFALSCLPQLVDLRRQIQVVVDLLDLGLGLSLDYSDGVDVEL